VIRALAVLAILAIGCGEIDDPSAVGGMGGQVTQQGTGGHVAPAPVCDPQEWGNVTAGSFWACNGGSRDGHPCGFCVSDEVSEAPHGCLENGQPSIQGMLVYCTTPSQCSECN
jgi:hypothetical protein